VNVTHTVCSIITNNLLTTTKICEILYPTETLHLKEFALPMTNLYQFMKQLWVLESDFYQINIQFIYHTYQSNCFLTAVTYYITCSSKKNMNAWLPVVTAKFWLRISQHLEDGLCTSGCLTWSLMAQKI
jgi:hypothetical protein